jgi:ankyrin repeat protein
MKFMGSNNSRYFGYFLDTMRCLLAHGADIDALHNDHATLLHLASHYGCVKGAQLLLEHGANVHLEDKEGRAPF